MARYEVVAAYGGLLARRIDLTRRYPWLYTIVVPNARLVYVGETYDPNGLAVRLGSHFGAASGSTLRQRASDIARTALKPPYLVVAARLPTDEDGAPFDASGKQYRLACERHLHELVQTRYIAARANWALVSFINITQGGAIPDTQVRPTCEAIYDALASAVRVYETLLDHSAFQLVLVDSAKAPKQLDESDVGGVLNQIENAIFDWVIRTIKTAHPERWWVECVPQAIRIECQTRREQEQAIEMPPEAFVMLINLREIIQKNWPLFSQVAESIGQAKGKDHATSWITEVNEIRKQWAHPLKQRYKPLEASRAVWLFRLHERLTEALLEADRRMTAQAAQTSNPVQE